MHTIRQATEDDIPALARLRAAWAAEQNSSTIDDPSFEKVFAEWHAANPRVTFVAELNGEVIGMMNLMIFNRMPKPGSTPSCWIYLGNAFVTAENRNGGVGSALMAGVVGYARKIEAVRIVLSPSPRSIEFYGRHGFDAASGLMIRQL